jgi:hypothetical protein
MAPIQLEIPTGEVKRSLDCLSKSLTDLEQQLTILESRLDPVLHPADPTPENPQAQYRCSLADNVGMKVVIVDRYCKTVAEIISRLEI